MMKRTLSMLLCLVMVLSFAAPAVQATEAGNVSTLDNIMDNIVIEDGANANIVIDGETVNLSQGSKLPNPADLVTKEEKLPYTFDAPVATVPEVEAGCQCADLASAVDHSGVCLVKAPYMELCEASADALFAQWDTYTAVEQDYLLKYLYEAFPVKHNELEKLLNAPTGSASETYQDGTTVSVEGIPQDGSLTVGEAANEIKEIVNTYVAEQEETLSPLFGYDVSVQDAEGADWQPETSVKMELELPGEKLHKNTRVFVVHVDDEGNATTIEAQVTEDGKIAFETPGFSAFYGFTVDFHYEDITFSINGMSSIKLSELFAKLHMPVDVENVADVEFTNDEYIRIEKLEADWELFSLKAFSTTEALTLTMKDGQVYEIAVTDAQVAKIYMAAGGVGTSIPNNPTNQDTDGNGIVTWEANYNGGGLSDSPGWTRNGIIEVRGPGSMTIRFASGDTSLETLYVDLFQFKITGGANVTFDFDNTFSSTNKRVVIRSSAHAVKAGASTAGAYKGHALLWIDNGTLSIEGKSSLSPHMEFVIGGNDSYEYSVRETIENNPVYAKHSLILLGDNATSLTVKHTEFMHTASGAIGAYNGHPPSSVTMYLEGCKFYKSVQNKTGRTGGAVQHYQTGTGGSFTAKNCTFSGNLCSTTRGGAIATYAQQLGSFTIENCKFENCSAGTHGGAISLQGAVGNVSITGTKTADGKGGYDYGTKFVNCTAAGRGGGVGANCSSFGNITVQNILVSGNTAASLGGGLHFGNTDGASPLTAGSLKVTNCDFLNNQAESLGGGLAVTDGQYQSIEIQGCTFDGCNTTGYGGGLGMKIDGTARPFSVVKDVKILGCTFKNCFGGKLAPNGYLDSVTQAGVEVWKEEDNASVAGLDKLNGASGAGAMIIGGNIGGKLEIKGNSAADPMVIENCLTWNNGGAIFLTDDLVVAGTKDASGKVTEAVTLQYLNINKCFARDAGGAVYLSSTVIPLMNVDQCTIQNCGYFDQSNPNFPDSLVKIEDRTFATQNIYQKKADGTRGDVDETATANNKTTLLARWKKYTKAQLYAGTDYSGTIRTVGNTGCVAKITNCDIKDNHSYSNGGGVYWNANRVVYKDPETKQNVDFTSSLTITNTLIHGNSASTFGGGIFCEGSVTIESSEIYNNTSDQRGGGIAQNVYNNASRQLGESGATESTTLILRAVEGGQPVKIYGNTAKDGGGISITCGLTNSYPHTVKSGTAKEDEGKPANWEFRKDFTYEVNFNLGGSHVYENKATLNGGGIYYSTAYFLDRTDAPDDGVSWVERQRQVDSFIKDITIDDGLIYGNIAGYGATDNTNGGSGGGVYMNSNQVNTEDTIDAGEKTGSSTVTITGGQIYKNRARIGNGGGVYLTGVNALCTITGETTTIGAEYLGTSNGKANLSTDGANEATNYRIGVQNYVGGCGGGIAIFGGARIEMEGGYIVNNLAYTAGGGVAVHGADSSMYLHDGYIDGNESSTGGGISLNKALGDTNAADEKYRYGMYFDGGVIRNNIASHNEDKIAYGGGICVSDNATMKFAGGEVSGNKAVTDSGTNSTVYAGGQEGGGIAVCKSSTLTVTGGRITSNRAYQGGGVVVRGGSSVNMSGDLVLYTKADATADAAKPEAERLGIEEGDVNLTESTGVIAGNIAWMQGGGVYMPSGSNKFTMTNGCINANMAYDKTTMGSTYDGGASCNGGGVYCYRGTFTLEGGHIDDNKAHSGGGILAYLATITINDGYLLRNAVRRNGGAIYSDYSTVNVEGGVFRDNSTDGSGASDPGHGGAIFSYGSSSTASVVTITGGEFYNNTATQTGGAVSVQGAKGSFTVSNGIFENNSAGTNGGAFYCSAPNATIESGTFKNNTAQSNGGAFCSVGSTAVITGGEFYNNKATNNTGGAVSVQGTTGSFTVSDGIFENNTAGTDGGAFYCSAPNATIEAGTFENNTAQKHGGALCSEGSTVVITGGEFYGNKTNSQTGGAVSVRGSTGSFTVSNATFRNNTATLHGGAFYCSAPNATVISGVFENNIAKYHGGAFCSEGSHVTINGGDFIGNMAYKNGGGAYFSRGAVVTISDGYFKQNEATNGGGMAIKLDTSVQISGGTFELNKARTSGGGIHVNGATSESPTKMTTLTMAGGKIFKNNAVNDGGGVCVTGYAQVSITTGVVGSNTTRGEITENSANNGGGIFVTEGADLSVIGGYITYNNATAPAGSSGLDTGYKVNSGLYGTGGGICVTKGSSDAYSTFTLEAPAGTTDMAIYGNMATFSADDVFASGEYTQLTVPNVKQMNMEEYGFAPEGWFEDYNTADSMYYEGINMLQVDEYEYEAKRYRDAYGSERIHIEPLYVTGKDGNKTAEASRYYVNKPGAYVAMTLGLPAAVDDTVVVDFTGSVNINLYENDMFITKAEFAHGNSYLMNELPTPDGDKFMNKNFIYLSKVMPAAGDYAQHLRYKPTANVWNGNANTQVDNKGIVTYSPFYKTMAFPTEDTFAYLVKHGEFFYYAKVTVIPATTLYFEDHTNFVTYHTQSSKEDLAQWISVNKVGSTTVTTDNSSPVQDQDRPGFLESEDLEGLDADSIYGYDSAYASTSTFSNGSTHWTQASRHKPVDNNGDGTCDKCSKKVTHDWKDTNSDGVCDVCKASCNHHCKDTNGDNKCNTCGKWMVHTCVDTNGDYRCDICGGWFEHELNGFSNDAVCDSCGDMIHHSCEDTNGDYQCDTCHRILDHVCSNQSGSYWCEFCKRWIEHQWVDQNEDNKCDTCKNRQHHECADADNDHKCDVCHLWMQHTCADKNKDYWCDICGLWMIHNWKDTDGNQICDTCDHVNHHDCQDANRDDACDICSRWMKHDCIDNKAPKNYCDVCGMSVGTHTVSARATFTFTGTGFDIVSLCNNKTGIVMVSVYSGVVTDFDNPPYDRYVASYMVDNYYGYRYDEQSKKWVLDPDSTTSLYQVPVIKADLTKVVIVPDDPNTPDVDEGVYEDYGYGTYSVEIYVAPSFMENEAGYWSADFYLDAIRVYNPAGLGEFKNAVTNQVIQDAYQADNEGWPVYTELRNLFINQKDLGVTTTNGVIFIDGQTNPTVADYTSWGPNNEVYLNPNQSIAFTLDTQNSTNVANIHLGMRGLTGTSNVYISYGTSADDQFPLLTKNLSTTDMYYSIYRRSVAGKVVVITNKGEKPIAISTVKVTHTAEPEYPQTFRGFRVDQNTAQIALDILNAEALAQSPVVTPKHPALSFNGMVCYNVFFSAENLGNLTADDLGLAVFSTEDTEGTIETAREVIYGATQIDGLYMTATGGVHAKYLGDKQYFRAFAKQEDGTIVYSKMVSYSALDYAKNVLAKSDDVKLKQLVVAMLNYGAEAQKFFGYKTDDLMNASLTADEQALLAGFDASSLNPVGQMDASKVGAFASNGGFSKKSPAISFKGAFEINYFFTPANTVDGDMKLYFWTEDTYNSVNELTAENADKAVVMTLENGTYTATSDEIAAKYLDKTVYVAAVYESNGETYCSGVLPYSIAAYCQNPPAGVQDLATAAAIYGCTAKQYFGV